MVLTHRFNKSVKKVYHSQKIAHKIFFKKSLVNVKRIKQIVYYK